MKNISSDSLKEMMLSLNALLTDIYGEPKRISEILSNFGLSQKQINDIKGERFAAFYANVKFALECRFLHYSGGYRLLTILYRRYGLFEYKKETLDEIGNSMGVSRERIRQLQNKAIKRLVGGVSADATGILLLLCACHVLGLDASTYLMIDENSIYSTSETTDSLADKTEEQDDKDEVIIEPVKPFDLPKATFYISGSFNYGLLRGKYRILMKCGDYRKYVEGQDLEGHSDVHMILLAVIAGLEMLRKPFDVTVYSNTLFGISHIYKNGTLRDEVSSKASNYELKEKIRQILREQGHYLSNIADNDIKTKINEYMI